jgi:hypothetical protein
LWRTIAIVALPSTTRSGTALQCVQVNTAATVSVCLGTLIRHADTLLRAFFAKPRKRWMGRGSLWPMPDIRLIPVDEEPDSSTGHVSVLDVKEHPIHLPALAGEVNLLCGHCGRVLAERLAALSTLRGETGDAFLGCPGCGKYSQIPNS